MIKLIKDIKDVFVSEESEPVNLKKVNKPTMLEWLFNRLGEKSTWRGIFTVLTVLGVSLTPELKTAIITAGVSVIGLLEVIFKEPQSKDAKKNN